MKKRLISVILAITLLLATAATIAFASNGKLGDMNDDGEITASDARTILRASAKLVTLDEDRAKRADTDRDGKLTAADARLTLRVSAKLDVFEEDTTDEEPPVTEPQPVEYPNAVKAFTEGKYYLNGIVENSENVGVNGYDMLNIKIAVDGNNFEIIMEDAAPVRLSLATIRGKKYLKTVDTSGKKMYTELTKELIDFINTVLNADIEFDSLLSDINFGKFTNPGEPEIDSPFAGISTYSFTVGKSNIVFYEEKGEIKKIVAVDADGNETTITVLSMTSTIPSDMLTLDGFSKKTILEIADSF